MHRWAQRCWRRRWSCGAGLDFDPETGTALIHIWIERTHSRPSFWREKTYDNYVIALVASKRVGIAKGPHVRALIRTQFHEFTQVPRFVVGIYVRLLNTLQLVNFPNQHSRLRFTFLVSVPQIQYPVRAAWIPGANPTCTAFQ